MEEYVIVLPHGAITQIALHSLQFLEAAGLAIEGGPAVKGYA